MVPKCRFLGSALFVCIYACLLVVGCGEPKGTITGTVTYKNEKVTSGQVSAFNVTRGVPFLGEIDKDGSFTISNLPYGDYKLTVVQMSKGPSLAAQMKKSREKLKNKEDVDFTEAKENVVRPQHRLPQKYADLATTDLSITVDKAENQIELKLTDPDG